MNPFLVSRYQSPTYFCNRQKETEKIINAITNNRDITLVALRRMGKTGLATHVGNKLKRNHSYNYVYSDVYHTDDAKSLLNEMSSAAFNLISKQRTPIQMVAGAFKNTRPGISFDVISGNPQLEYGARSEQDAFKRLEELFAVVDKLPKKTCWVIDEFQQISTYTNSLQVFKLLRKIIQKCSNINFVFSGSDSSLFLSVLKKSSQPFFNSTQLLELKEIDFYDYKKFIAKHFKKANKEIGGEVIDWILELTGRHTWYVQMLCNRLYQQSGAISIRTAKKVLEEICREQEIVFYRYRQLMSKGQWRLLIAVAKEKKVYQPTGTRFISSHDLKGSASVLRSLKKLKSDEFIVEVNKEDGTYYRLNDIFLMTWIQGKY